MEQQKIIDSHFHVFDLDVRNSFPNQNQSMGFPDHEIIQRNHTVNEAEECMKGSNVAGAVFVQCYKDCPQEVDWILQQAKDSKIVAGVVGGLDLLNHDELKRNISKYSGASRPRFIGVRYLAVWDENDFMGRDDLHQGLKILADNNLTFDWHTATSGSPSTIKFIPQVASKLPNLKIVINHIAKPFQISFQPWADEMTAAAKHPNVYCKLSGLNDEVKFYDAEELKPYIDHCLAVFGPSRCMFGSDWPVCKKSHPDDSYATQVSLMKQLTSHLTAEEQHMVFYQTAVNFYGLDI